METNDFWDIPLVPDAKPERKQREPGEPSGDGTLAKLYHGTLKAAGHTVAGTMPSRLMLATFVALGLIMMVRWKPRRASTVTGLTLLWNLTKSAKRLDVLGPNGLQAYGKS